MSATTSRKLDSTDAVSAMRALYGADLPRNASEVAQRLQRRLSGFALVMGTVCRDVETMQRIATELRGGFGLADADRELLDVIALRLFDACEVLNANA